jgi:hypothetical protein
VKLVREHILFEKFTEEGDPIHDMGIGLSTIINQAIKKIFKEDSDKIYVKPFEERLIKISQNSSFQHMSVEKDKFFMKLFSNRYYDKNGKKIDKKKYCIKLLKYADIFRCMEKKIKVYPPRENEDSYIAWEYTFTIKPEYVKYFKAGMYYPEEYIK